MTFYWNSKQRRFGKTNCCICAIPVNSWWSKKRLVLKYSLCNDCLKMWEMGFSFFSHPPILKFWDNWGKVKEWERRNDGSWVLKAGLEWSEIWRYKIIQDLNEIFLLIGQNLCGLTSDLGSGCGFSHVEFIKRSFCPSSGFSWGSQKSLHPSRKNGFWFSCELQGSKFFLLDLKWVFTCGKHRK